MMVDGWFVILVFVAAIAIGFVTGIAVTDSNWARDCDALGLHRNGGAVYVCKPQPK